MERKKKGKRAWLETFLSMTCFVIFTFIAYSPAFGQFATYVPGGTLDPTTIPKYVTPLVIPPVMPTSTASPAPVANYDIAVRQFQQQILPAPLPATTVWSYGRAQDVIPGGFIAPVARTAGVSFNYPAFTVENISGSATTVRWINDLVDGVGNFLPHLFPVDQGVHWANPATTLCNTGLPNRTDCRTNTAAPYTGAVPLVTHVHGAHVQPHSDGYPEAWWLPGAPGTKGIPASYSQRGSSYTQANNTNVVAGSAFYAYENSQAAATLWYHDHAIGMTRLNVYAGPAGFWLVRGGAFGDGFVDDFSTPAANDGVLPGPAPVGAGDPNFDAVYRATIREIPIAIQDRSFNTNGSLFYPQNRTFFDGFTGPYIGGTGTPVGPSDILGIWNPEAFFNTMVVNGTTWPKFDVAPARYRFRLLNGCNSRTLNLAMFVVTAGNDLTFGTADDVLVAEVPFYQIGAEQGFLPKVVKIVTGFATQLPGNGTIPAPVPAANPAQALLLIGAERADVIVDFSGMANGTRIRMINTAPDAPFQGFPTVPADPGTSGQVMDFIVNTALTVTTSTLPQNLVLPAEPPLGVATNTRKLSLNEMESEQVCIAFDAFSGAIIGTLYSVAPGDPTFVATCLAFLPGPVNISAPMAPKEALLGVVTGGLGNLTAVTKFWSDPITEAPLLNRTEVWEIYNTTIDAHPIHLHLVGFEVINREAFTIPVPPIIVPSGVTTLPNPNELGYKDTVVALPGQITRIKARFDIAGLYVWHCHIVEHEDNEMMRPYRVRKLIPDVDFDGDGKTDIAVWRPGDSVWYIIPSSPPGTPYGVSWGLSGDVPVPGDFDGDGKTDIAVWRSGDSVWYIIPSSTPGAPYGVGWGISTDIPVPGDYDGDGKTDIAVYRSSNGGWYIIPSLPPGTPYGVGWGGDASDIPVPGDYDGDGKTDIAVYRGSNGGWYIIPSSTPGAPYGVGWGISTDIPVPGDYDGDGKTDIAVYRGSNGGWYIIPSSTPGAPYGVGWGVAGDVPINY